MHKIKSKWDDIYAQMEPASVKPTQVLSENLFLLPKQGYALDLACGLGANSLLLAQKGLQVSAWDISEVALEKLAATVISQGLSVDVKARSIDNTCFVESSFDVIVVSRFLDRTLTNAIIGALKVGGLLFYQTYTLIKANQGGPTNSAFLLGQAELLQLFNSLQVIYYRENGLIGDLKAGLRNEAQFIGQKL